MIKTLFLVAAGGALGACLRYLLGVGVYRVTGGPTPFPIAIMTANILGSIALGVFIAVAAHRGLTALAPFVMVGLLGGFTTFSSFSMESVRLIENGHYSQAALYVGLSVGLSIGGLFVGLWAARGVLS